MGARLPRTLVAGTALAFLAVASSAHAQAWVPREGTGTVSVLFSNVKSTEHFLPDEPIDLGTIDSHTLLFDATYGVTDRLAVSLGVPLMVTRYTGPAPHRPITLDDGRWHGAFQDFRFGVRYNLTRGPVVVTPFVGGYVPSHGYEYYAHSAPGRRRRELLTGVSIAKLLPEANVVVQGRYGFAVGESFVDIRPKYSEFALETAYFLGPTFRVFGMASGRYSHSGIDLTRASPQILPFEVFVNHDRITREHVLNLGGGAAMSLSDTIDVFGSYTRTVTGRNTHAVNRGIAVGITWSFDMRRTGETTSAQMREASAREESLVRCLCEKRGR